MFSAATKTGSQPSAAANYIEDVFSTYLYTGTGAAQTITNNIDLSTKGGMVWTKQRSGTRSNNIVDTVRGGDNMIYTNATDAQFSLTGLGFSPFTFSSTGFVESNAPVNAQNGTTFCSWTFREQAKFFDVVTYTGNGTSSQTISHNLGSAPGMIIIKALDAGAAWAVYHRSLGATQFLNLNTTDAAGTSVNYWNDTSPTSTNFTVSRNSSTGANNTNYVAYLFAHDAGGFGTTGTDNVISCGSFVTTAGGAVPTVTLGYEPQYLMFKCSSSAGNWNVIDNMRAFSQTQTLELFPNATTAETDYGIVATPTATGFTSGAEVLAGSATFIYMAIRRPMKVPTDATTVFIPVIGTNTNPSFVTNFPVDLNIATFYTFGSDRYVSSRLQGNGQYLLTNSTVAEATSTSLKFDYQNGCNTLDFNTAIGWNFSRRPGFFDEVCYTGTGSATTFNHNLGVVPELMIVKGRNLDVYWYVYSATLGATKAVYLNATDASGTSSTWWNNTTPTSSVFTLGTGATNSSGSTYVSYLFATCPGVSKVGSYTGNGTTQAISCGFTGGARFVLIKRTNATGDWYVYDTARGMTTLTDPYLLINSIPAQTATLGSVTTTAGGFTVDATILTAINASGGTYIFLAIA